MVARNKWIVRIYDNYGTYDEALAVVEFGADAYGALAYTHEYNKTHDHTYAAFPIEVCADKTTEDLLIDEDYLLDLPF